MLAGGHYRLIGLEVLIGSVFLKHKKIGNNGVLYISQYEDWKYLTSDIVSLNSNTLMCRIYNLIMLLIGCTRQRNRHYRGEKTCLGVHVWPLPKAL